MAAFGAVEMIAAEPLAVYIHWPFCRSKCPYCDFNSHVRDGIDAASHLAKRLEALAEKPDEIAQAMASLRRPDPALAAELAASLADELPLFKRDGGFVREGCLAALDEARALRDESRKVIAGLQARYADDSGVKSARFFLAAAPLR